MIRIFTGLFLAIVLSACSKFPYRIDVDQGNLVDQQALSRLQLGMTKSQVKQVLGAALLSDVFHQDRWDYIQHYKQGGAKEMKKSDVSLYFTNGLLSRVVAENYQPIQHVTTPYSISGPR